MTARIPSTENVIRILCLLHPNISTDELEAELHGLGLSPTKFAVSHRRIEFLAILKLLRGFDLLKDEKPVASAWLKAHRKSRNRSRRSNIKKAAKKLNKLNGRQPRKESPRTVQAVDSSTRRGFKPWKSKLRKWHFPG
jgi:hypothetical protein